MTGSLNFDLSINYISIVGIFTLPEAAGRQDLTNINNVCVIFMFLTNYSGILMFLFRPASPIE